MGVRRGFHYKVAAARSHRQIIGTFGLSRDIPDKKRAEEKLEALVRELREKNKTLEQDLEMARELQQAMLPHRYPCFPDHSSKGESSVRFYPLPALNERKWRFFRVLKLSDTRVGIFLQCGTDGF